MRGDRGVDVLGAVLVTGGLMSIVYALAKAATPTEGWTSPTVLLFGGVGLALLVAFVVTEMRYRAPLVRLSIFRIRSLSTANGAMLLVAGGMFAMFYFAGLYVQIVLGYSPFQAGLAFLPVCVGIGVGAGLASQPVKRYRRARGRVRRPGHRRRRVLPAAADQRRAAATSTCCCRRWSSCRSGMGLSFVPLTLVATTTVSADDAGLASGLLNTSQQVGGSLGLAILATLAVDRTTAFFRDLGHAPSAQDGLAALVQGYRVAFLGGGHPAGAGRGHRGGVPAAQGRGRHHRRGRRRAREGVPSAVA